MMIPSFAVDVMCIKPFDEGTGRLARLFSLLLKRITARITAEVPGIRRVCYDLTPKPAGTVEWE